MQVALNDPFLSRRHARLLFDGRRCSVMDLGRNGSALDDQVFQCEISRNEARVLRTGGTVFLLCPDVRPAPDRRRGARWDGDGPRPAQGVESHRPRGALRYHAARDRRERRGQGPGSAGLPPPGAVPAGAFIAVNCAAIPEGVAEGLLFGACMGAFSGAVADAEGYVQAAHQGTLFLDEVVDLESVGAS